MFRSGGGRLNLSQLILILRWLVIAVIGVLIFVVEVLEHPEALPRIDNIFTSKVFFLEGLLIVNGVAIGWLLTTVREKTNSLHILEVNNLNSLLYFLQVGKMTRIRV